MVARKLLAAVQIAQGRIADAAMTLAQAVDIEPTDPQLLAMAGAAAAQIGDFNAADRYLRGALQLHRDNAAVRTELGITQLALGQTDAGIAALDEASRQDPTTLRPDIALFLARFTRKDYGQALEAAERLEHDYPNEATGFDFAGATYLARGDSESARAEFMRARSLRAGDPTACRWLAILAARRGDMEAAISFYSEILNANPKDTAASIALAETEEDAGQRDAAIATLQKAVERNADSVEPRLMLGRFYIADRKYQAAASAVEPALGNAPKNAGLLEIAGEAELGLGNLSAALDRLKTLVELEPEESIGHRYLAAAYLASGQFDLALFEAKKSLDLDPRDSMAKMILARIDIAMADFSSARSLLEELALQYPNDAAIAALRGGLDVEQNRAPPKDAADAGDTAENRTRLALAETKAGQLEEAKKTLLDWLSTHPHDPLPRRALADIYLASNQIDDAQSQYRTLLEGAPNDAAAENNLAWILLRKGDAQGALDHAAHAASLSPNAAQILDTLGIALLQDRQIAASIETLTKASQIMPADPEIRFHIAQAFIGAGDNDKARDLLRTLLAENRSFEDRDKAESLLQNLGG